MLPSPDISILAFFRETISARSSRWPAILATEMIVILACAPLRQGAIMEKSILSSVYDSPSGKKFSSSIYAYAHYEKDF
jgi:hypothetical protein